MPPGWANLIAKAEKLLGGPAPFINLGSLLSSEAGFLAARARRLAATADHPFFSAISACLHGKTVSPSLLSFSQKLTQTSTSTPCSPYPSGGLIILLVGQCRAGNIAASTVLSNQHRSLAELFETVYMATTIHKSLVHPKKENRSWFREIFPGSRDDSDETWIKNMELGNKIATLAGDILFASVSATLAGFHNTEIVDIVSEAICDLLQAEFYTVPQEYFHGTTTLSHHDKDPDHVPNCSSSCGSASENWLQYIGSSRGSMMGSCCQSAVLLSEARLALSKTSRQVPKTDAPALLARQLGYHWATLLRLIEERDFVYQNAPVIQKRFGGGGATKTNPVTGRMAPGSFINYVENGLPEPTFIDAYLGEQVPAADLEQDAADRSVLSDHTAVLHQYDQLGVQLSQQLQNSFNQFQSSILTSSSASEKATLSALDLLRQMVSQLVTHGSHLRAKA